MKVVPAILSREVADYRRKLEMVASFTSYAQIDFMDGAFVPSRSIGAAEAGAVNVPVDHEIHLMVNDPLAWLEHLSGTRMKRVIFHYEIPEDPSMIADAIRKSGFSPGLAINPETPASEIEALLPKLDSVLVMSVNPGFYGSPFIPEAVAKAAMIKSCSSSMIVGMDGGISLDNLPLARQAGVDYVCVGSRILLSDDPEESFARLRDSAR